MEKIEFAKFVAIRPSSVPSVQILKKNPTVMVKIIQGKVQIVSVNKVAENKLAENKVAVHKVVENKVADNNMTGKNVAGNNVAVKKVTINKAAVNKLERDPVTGNKVTASENPESKSVSKCRVRLLTKQQCQILENQFSRSIYINRLQKEALATELNINPIQVAVWFNNRRLCELRKVLGKKKKSPAIPKQPIQPSTCNKMNNLPSTETQPQVLNKDKKKNHTPGLPTLQNNGKKKKSPSLPTQKIRLNGCNKEDNTPPAALSSPGMQPQVLNKNQKTIEAPTLATSPVLPTTINENVAASETWGYVGVDFYTGLDFTFSESQFSYGSNFTSSNSTPSLDCDYDFLRIFDLCIDYL